jgi:DNA-directed RNA polymerase subunit H (RpoH/RPB5)
MSSNWKTNLNSLKRIELPKIEANDTLMLELTEYSNKMVEVHKVSGGEERGNKLLYMNIDR